MPSWAKEGSGRHCPGKHCPDCVSSGEGRAFSLSCPSCHLKSSEGERFQGPAHQLSCWISPTVFELEEENGSHHRIFSLKRSSPFSNSDWNFLQYSGLEQVLAIQCNKQWKSWQCTFCFRHILYLTLWRDKICKENTSDFHALEQTHFKTLCPVFSTLSLTSPSVRKWNSGIPDFQMCSWSLWDINQILQDTRMPQNIWDPRPNRPSRSQDKGQESKP